METAKLRAVVLTVVMIGWLTAAIRESEAQDTASCASTLTPCANYINGTIKHPPASCCTPLKDALTNQKECLCNIFNNPSLLKTFNINVTDALSLPSRCNIAGASTTMCSASSPTSSTTNTSTAPPPPASGTNAADIVAWSGVSAVMVVMASLVLY